MKYFKDFCRHHETEEEVQLWREGEQELSGRVTEICGLIAVDRTRG